TIQDKDPTEERAKILDQINLSYKQGLNYFLGEDFDLAEKEFVKVLKPVLSKTIMQSIYVSVEDYKEEVLNAMYHLGKIYLSSTQYFNNYAKAAAIFQYSAAFAEKYNVTIYKSDGNKIELQKEAYTVEAHFLNSIGRVSDTKSIEDKVAKCAKEIEEYKQELLNLRAVCKEWLVEIDNITIERIAERAREVEKLYNYCTSSFVSNYSSKEQNPGLVQKVIRSCIVQLGPIPTGCEYSFIALGSLAGGRMTPWSDLEFAILINEDREEYKEYFKNLTKLMHIKVVNLGETPLRSMGVEALNNFRSAKEEDDWFWDEMLPNGFSFDGPDWHACKTPLGRQGGYKAKEKRKLENGTEEEIIVAKPDFELILTPKHLAAFQAEQTSNGGNINLTQESWFKSDMFLVQALRLVSLIDGSQDLLNKYRYEITEAADNKTVKSRALDKLQQDLSQFSLKLGDKEEGKLIDVKKDIFRIGDRIIDDLAYYYGVAAKGGQPGLSVWQTIDRMEELKILSKEGAQHLREAISIATELRIATYCHNKGQSENVSTYVPAVEHLSEKLRKLILEETFYIKETNILHRFYYVMLKVQQLVKLFHYLYHREYSTLSELVLQRDALLDDSNYIKGMVHARFLEYDKAIKEIEDARQKKPEDLSLFYTLFDLYTRAGNIKKAILLSEEMTVLAETTYKDNRNYTDISGIYNNIGEAYNYKGNYEQAINYHRQALDIRLKAHEKSLNNPESASSYNNRGASYNYKVDFEQTINYHKKVLEIKLRIIENGPNQPVIAHSYNNIGAVYNDEGDYEQAINYYNQALEIQLKAYEHRPNHHPDIAMSYNNLGIAYRGKGDYEQAINYHRQALKIRCKAYEHIPNHPDIAKSHNSLGIAYRDKGDYDKAIEYHNKALKIQFKAYEHSPVHPSIALTYYHLGCVYNYKENYDKAIEYHNKALEIQLKAYEHSPNNPNTGLIYNSLGNAYRNKGDHDKAIEYYNKALEIQLKAYEHSHDHPDIAITHHSLGNAYSEKRDYDKAIEYYNKALEIQLKAYEHSHDHPHIAITHYSLGIAFSDKGDYDQAIKYYKSAIEILSKTYEHSFNRTHIAWSYYKLSQLFSKIGKYQESYENATKAFEIFSKYRHESEIEDLQIIQNYALSQLGNLEILKGKLEKARDFYKKINDKLYNIDFNSVNFIQLINKQLEFAYDNNYLDGAVNSQLVLVKIDPQLRFDNHYHNLACFYSCKGEVQLANETFIKAINQKYYPVKASLYVDYAQFLILNKNGLNNDAKEASHHLYTALNSESDGHLTYGKLDKNSTCSILKSIIEEKNGTIEVEPKILAYYLLIKHPQYIAGSDTLEDYFKDFVRACDKRSDEISFKLLSDAYESVGKVESGMEYSKYASLLLVIDDIIAGKKTLESSLGAIDPAFLERLIMKLQDAALLAISEARYSDAESIYTKLFQMNNHKIIDDSDKLKTAINDLATVYLLEDNIKGYSDLKSHYNIQLNIELIKISSKDPAIVLELDNVITKQLQLYSMHKDLQSSINPTEAVYQTQDDTNQFIEEELQLAIALSLQGITKENISQNY
ncbi:MAG: hypothetical protein K0Q51_1562, partial [Rickettsiaceae bacterium]|nr:hypothetical protein [Rickettsiaceae bacterium]